MGYNVQWELGYRMFPCGAGSTAANLFEKGDMLYWDVTNNIVKAAGQFTWTTSEVVTRSNFKQYYIGIAGEANKSDRPARLVKVCTDVILDMLMTSSTAAISADAATSLVGPEKASGNTLEPQKLQIVQDPAEAIGAVVRRYTSATTQPTVRLTAVHIAGNIPIAQNRVAQIWVAAVTSGDKLTNMTAKEFFGGAAEVLKVMFHETTAIASAAAIMNLEKGTTDLTALTVPVTGAAIGRVTGATMAADANRIFGPNDTISLESSQGTTGAGNLYVLYRPLS